MKIAIGIVDDHQLFLKSLGLLLATSDNFEVVVEAVNGQDLKDKMNQLKVRPDIILLDVDMPKMNGVQTATWLSDSFPQIKLVALSMNDREITIIEMIKAGCCAYLLKQTHPMEFMKALDEIYHKGYYNADAFNINYRRLLLTQQALQEQNISEKEKEFIRYACSDRTYKEIALLMKVSERSVDSYRESLFHKLKVQSRVGLCLEAIRQGLASL